METNHIKTKPEVLPPKEKSTRIIKIKEFAINSAKAAIIDKATDVVDKSALGQPTDGNTQTSKAENNAVGKIQSETAYRTGRIAESVSSSVKTYKMEHVAVREPLAAREPLKGKETKTFGLKGKMQKATAQNLIDSTKTTAVNATVDMAAIGIGSLREAAQGGQVGDGYEETDNRSAKAVRQIKSYSDNQRLKKRQQRRSPAKNSKPTFRQRAKNHFVRRRQTELLLNKRELNKTHSVAAKIKDVVRNAAKVIKAALKTIVSMIAGGAPVMVVFLVAFLIIALLTSPFGIIFSGQTSTPGTVTLSAAVAQVNEAFSSYLDNLPGSDTATNVEMHGDTADWADVVAVFSVKTAANEEGVSADVATLDNKKVDELKKVFWDMHSVVSRINYNDDDETTTMTIHINAKSYTDMAQQYRFSVKQINLLNALIKEKALISSLIGQIGAASGDAADAIQNLPEGLPPERKNTLKSALSLVGKVNYFWGGKSTEIGWDSRWGRMQKVTSAGSKTTGSYRPYGLDCSGFVSWAWINASGDVNDGNRVGNGAAGQHAKSKNISWNEALPGDLVFYPDDSHVGIVVANNGGGRLQVVHCNASKNNVTISDAKSVGFTTVARPRSY